MIDCSIEALLEMMLINTTGVSESVTEGMKRKGKTEISNLQCKVCAQGQFVQSRKGRQMKKQKLHFNFCTQIYSWT